MITLQPHSDTEIILRNTWEHRDALKALNLHPDLHYDGKAKCWLVNLRALPDLYAAAGDRIAPHSPEFWLTLPLPAARPQRRARRRRQAYQQRAQERAAAQAFGRDLAAMKHDTLEQQGASA